MFSLKHKPLNKKCMVMVMNVYNYFHSTCENVTETAIAEKTAVACGISVSTVKRTKRRIQTAETEGTSISSPQKHRRRSKSKSEDVDDFVKAVTRSKIYSKHSKLLPVTLQGLVQELREDEVFDFSVNSLRRCLQSIGFSYSMEDQRRGLLEQPHIAALRETFWREYTTNKRHEIFDPVFLDETCIFAKGSQRKSWHDDDKQSNRKKSMGEGKRYIIMHAGNSDGFVNGAAFIFSSTSKKADYYDNMNAVLFKKWFIEQLLPNLEKPSLIIFDNATYHCRQKEKQPTTNWRKEELLEYLKAKGVPYNPEMLRVELYALARDYRCDNVYEIDEIANEQGHKVLRLPPYHRQFNPIELVWANCKEYYNKQIGRDGFGDGKVLEMCSESLSQVTGDHWNKCISHAEKEMMKFWELEQGQERIREPVVINLQEDSSDEEYEYQEDSDMEEN